MRLTKKDLCHKEQTKNPQRNHVWEDALKMNQEILCGFAVTRNSTQLFYCSQLNIHLFVVNYFYSYLSVIPMFQNLLSALLLPDFLNEAFNVFILKI